MSVSSGWAKVGRWEGYLYCFVEKPHHDLLVITDHTVDPIPTPQYPHARPLLHAHPEVLLYDDPGVVAGDEDSPLTVDAVDWSIVSCEGPDTGLSPDRTYQLPRLDLTLNIAILYKPSLIFVRGGRLQVPDVDVLVVVRGDDDLVVEVDRPHVNGMFELPDGLASLQVPQQGSLVSTARQGERLADTDGPDTVTVPLETFQLGLA